jgi:hypothetical protein
MKNSQKYMRNRIRFLVILSWVVVVIGVGLVGAVIVDAFTGTVGIIVPFSRFVAFPQEIASIAIPATMVVIIALLAAIIFSALVDQAALLQTALNVDTHGAELVEEVRIMNKYLRQIVPFMKEPPGKP